MRGELKDRYAMQESSKRLIASSHGCIGSSSSTSDSVLSIRGMPETAEKESLGRQVCGLRGRSYLQCRWLRNFHRLHHEKKQACGKD